MVIKFLEMNDTPIILIQYRMVETWFTVKYTILLFFWKANKTDVCDYMTYEYGKVGYKSAV